MKYPKVDIGDGGIGSKSIADVSCSFFSNIVALHWLMINRINQSIESINQSINKSINQSINQSINGNVRECWLIFQSLISTNIRH